MTYNVTFLEQDHYYFAFRDGKMHNLAFDKRFVTKEYVHLLGSSASMYEAFGNIQRESYRLCQLLDESMKGLDKAEQAATTNLVNFLQGIQDTCLNMRRLAEVGTDRLAFEVNAQNKVKKA